MREGTKGAQFVERGNVSSIQSRGRAVASGGATGTLRWMGLGAASVSVKRRGMCRHLFLSYAGVELLSRASLSCPTPCQRLAAPAPHTQHSYQLLVYTGLLCSITTHPQLIERLPASCTLRYDALNHEQQLSHSLSATICCVYPYGHGSPDSLSAATGSCSYTSTLGTRVYTKGYVPVCSAVPGSLRLYPRPL